MTTQAIAIALQPPLRPEVLEPEADTAIEEGLQQAAASYRSTMAELAYFSFRWMLCEGWTRRGYEPGTAGENAYREEVLQVPRSSYFRARRIGQALHQLSIDELRAIRPTNLELLLQVSPTLWSDFRWVHEAKLLKPKRFAELIVERNRAAGDTREPLARFSVKVPFLARQAMETMVEEFRKKNELSSTGQALELLIADRHDRVNLLSAAAKASEMIRGVIRSLDTKGRITLEAREWLKLAKEVLDEARAKEIQAARSQSKGRKEAS